jgi:hypothetical protein
MVRYTLTAIILPIVRGCPIGCMIAPVGGYRHVGLLGFSCSRWANPPLGVHTRRKPLWDKHLRQIFGRKIVVNPYGISTYVE